MITRLSFESNAAPLQIATRSGAEFSTVVTIGGQGILCPRGRVGTELDRPVIRTGVGEIVNELPVTLQFPMARLTAGQRRWRFRSAALPAA
jgi:hypothetical protein